ncbi:RCC1 domain-containing protein [Nannocystaceae bacterium ST9]
MKNNLQSSIWVGALLLLSCGRVAEVEEHGAVALFGSHSVVCAQSESGEVKCWGMNVPEYYPISDVGWVVGDNEALTQLNTLETGGLLLQLEVSAIDGGAACMRLEGERLRCWGNDSDSEMGSGADLLPNGEVVTLAQSEAIFVDGLSAVSLGWSHACILVRGDVFCWGTDLGTGGSVSFEAAMEHAANGEQAVEIGEEVVEVGAGGGHSCVRTTNGSVYCWGLTIDTGHSDPNLGFTVGDDETPQEAGPLPLGAPARGLSVTGAHTCALLETGTAVCWGDGITVEAAEEVAVASPFAQVVAGGSYTCAVTTEGELHCWGQGLNGALGTGDLDAVPASAPAHIELDELIVDVVPLGSATCVRSETGKVKCWGRRGILGQPTDEDLGDDEPVSEIPWLNLGF